jgi:flagellar FliL protein
MEEEKKEEEQEGQKEQEKPGKKPFPTNIVIICILALCLVGGGLFVWKGGILSRLKGDDSAQTPAPEMENKKPDIGPIYSLETFIVNLLGGRGKNYLKVKIDLELDNPKVTEEINRRLPQFRDAILTMLSNKTHEDIKTLEGKYQLREEIISMLNQYLSSGKIKNVFFTDFIVQ